MNADRRDRGGERAAALVTTIIVIAVLAVVAVAFMQSTTVDRFSSRSVANFTKARLAADAGAAVAQGMVAGLVARYPDSATTWQNIGGGSAAGTNNEATVLYVRAQAANTNLGATPGQFGPEVVLLAQPLVSRLGPAPGVVSSNLFPLGDVVSALPFATSSVSAVNINATNASRPEAFVGVRSATNPGSPVTAAEWIYLVDSDGRTNARYAFWIEDESFKVNVNVATNGPRGTASLGTNTAEIRLDGSLQSSTNASLNGANVSSITSARSALPGSNFPTASTAILPLGVTNGPASAEFRFLMSGHSRSLNLSRGGFRRFAINTLTNGLPGAARENLNRALAAITNSNSAPNFGQRFYRLATGSAGINNTSAVTTAHAAIYLQKIAANLLDYLDADDQPTIISNAANFPLLPAAKPEFGIEPAGGGTAGANPIAAFGIENLPRLQEYAIHGRILQMSPIGYNTNSPPPDIKADYRISIDHYFEFWNPGTRDITLTNAFLKVYDQPRFGNNITGDLANEGRPFELPLGTVSFPAGRVTVLTTAPAAEVNTSLVSAANRPNVVSISGASDSHRIFSGVTRDTSTNTFSGFNRLFNVSMRPRSTSITDYESAMLLGNSQGILESFVGLPIVTSGGFVPALHFVVGGAAVQGTIGNLTAGNAYFARGGSLAGNSSATSAPSSREGDPRALNEQLEFVLYQTGSGGAPDDQTRFFSSGLADGSVPANSSLGAPNNNYVNPSNWVDFSSISSGASNAPLFVRNSALQTIGELGHLTDPARVKGTTPSVMGIANARGGGRTLRVGQPEHPQWFDGNQTNASRTWTSWRLADIFSVTNALTITGAVNPNGILRDGGAALRAALFGFQFQPSPEGATVTANRAITVNNLVSNAIGRMTNITGSGMPANSLNVFWERGEISQLSLLNSGTALASVSMSNAFDRGREELVRRSIEMITTRGSVFTVYAIGQALQVSPGGTNILSTCRVKTTFELVPQFANISAATNDFFATGNAASRFVAPTNYQIRVLATQYD